MTVAACRGFVYATAVMGVTGARATTSDLAGPLVARTKARPTDLPVGVGLGVSNGDQAAEVASYADGVIVGSAFVRVLLDHPDDRAAGLRALTALTEDLAGGSTPWRRAAVALCAAVALARRAARAAAATTSRPATCTARSSTRRSRSPQDALVDTDGERLLAGRRAPTSGSPWSSSATPTAPTSAAS